MKKIILFLAGLAFFTLKNQAQTVTDYDGNVYDTIHIGTQIWLKENLKTTHYSDGAEILDGTSAGDISGNYTSKYYFDYENHPTNTVIYGKLYTWAAVMNREASSNSNPGIVQGVCPIGWHIPSDAEWNSMEKYLDITVDSTLYAGWSGTDIGNKLKESGIIHWLSGNNGNNSSNFTGLPGGSRYPDGSFDNLNANGTWWTSAAYNSSSAWYRELYYGNANILRDNINKSFGLSVRCVMDSLGTFINENNIEKHIQIYPNPASERVYIYCEERKDFKMQVYNMIGECVLQRELDRGTNEIDIHSLSKGIYVIKLTGTNWTGQKKLIKE
jgi:uncharacterized protein (TIGR02145 family)